VASSHAASDCATDTAHRAAPRGRVGVRARTAILAFGARNWPLASSASAAATRGARRRAAPRRAARRARHVEQRRAVASATLLAHATDCCVLACAGTGAMCSRCPRATLAQRCAHAGLWGNRRRGQPTATVAAPPPPPLVVPVPSLCAGDCVCPITVHPPIPPIPPLLSAAPSSRPSIALFVFVFYTRPSTCASASCFKEAQPHPPLHLVRDIIEFR